MSLFSSTSALGRFTTRSLLSRPLPSGLAQRRLNSSTSSNNKPGSTPRPSSHAPQQSRSNFPVIPIIAIFLMGSGSYILLVKSRTGTNQSRPSN
ncbi:hypothetical protein N7533_008878 [Penicillium manginii]|uniref:uncharacterized protein n=1 Tax=Penicillium manginii TaxID=203109 RepID=UPI00254945C0|nr:uncharacterized protein N7533_008878 [Penicillium manginii]KAJ5744008.1 hypothetical protein N7533_008878 [Penicillium manginii]